MKINHGLKAGLVSLGVLFSGFAQAAVVIGTYTFQDSQLVDQVTSFTPGKQAYDGVSLINPLTTPQNITDKDPVSAGATHISTLPASSAANANGFTIGLGFGADQVVNGTGNDLALFFLFDQSGNDIKVTINGVQQTLSTFSNVVDGDGDQQFAQNVDWNGGKLNNVLLTSAEVDLSAFGLTAGATINSLSVMMTQSEVAPFEVVSMSLVGALHATTVVPVPAAAWLFGSGLIGLAGFARRKS